MKKLGLVIALLAMTAVPALAGQIYYKGQAFSEAGAGGEFTFYAVDGPATQLGGYAGMVTGHFVLGSFQTFCIEQNEWISTDDNYNPMYYSLDTAATKGGRGGPSPDPVSVGTGYLYQQFALGTLTGYDYTARTDQRTLQEAFWFLEDEISLTTPLNNKFLALLWGGATPLFGSDTAAKADGAERYGVYALNVWNVNSPRVDRQSQLFHVPDGGTTLALLGLALAGLGAMRRGFRS